LDEFKKYIDKDNVKVKLNAGNYQIDDAKKIRFMESLLALTHTTTFQVCD
jgi:hypothetical protein